MHRSWRASAGNSTLTSFGEGHPVEFDRLPANNPGQRHKGDKLVGPRNEGLDPAIESC
jgi:hypothetical protein